MKDPNRKKRQLLNWSADRWISFTALFIAACSLFITISELRASKEHARISAQPRLSYTYFYGKDGAGWRRTNGGLGAARLRGFRMFVDGKPVYGYGDLWEKLKVPFVPNYRFTNPYVGTRYPAGTDNILFWANPGPTAGFTHKNWKRVVFQSCYCSLYDECWITASDGSLLESNGEHKQDDDCSIFMNEKVSLWWRE